MKISLDILCYCVTVIYCNLINNYIHLYLFLIMNCITSVYKLCFPSMCPIILYLFTYKFRFKSVQFGRPVVHPHFNSTQCKAHSSLERLLVWLNTSQEHLTLDTWHLILDTWCLTLDTWHLTFDTCHLTLDTWNLVLDAGSLTLVTWHLTLILSSSPNLRSALGGWPLYHHFTLVFISNH